MRSVAVPRYTSAKPLVFNSDGAVEKNISKELINDVDEMKYQFNMPPEWIRTSTLEAALKENRHSTLVVSKSIAAALTRLQQLANVAAQGTAPAVARVDLRTWRVTLETPEEEQVTSRFGISYPRDLCRLESSLGIGDLVTISGVFKENRSQIVVRHYRIVDGKKMERIPDEEWELMKTKVSMQTSGSIAPAPD